jgi:hypothetical protein
VSLFNQDIYISQKTQEDMVVLGQWPTNGNCPRFSACKPENRIIRSPKPETD